MKTFLLEISFITRDYHVSSMQTPRQTVACKYDSFFFEDNIKYHFDYLYLYRSFYFVCIVRRK